MTLDDRIEQAPEYRHVLLLLMTATPTSLAAVHRELKMLRWKRQDLKQAPREKPGVGKWHDRRGRDEADEAPVRWRHRLDPCRL
jgi:hypothetical protein